MKKQITVKRLHRYQKTRDILYQGIAEFTKQEHGIILRYQENNKEANVQCEVHARHDHIDIKRSGETTSTLHFEAGKRTKGILSSPYGDIDIDLHTYRYQYHDDVITLEYDIYNGNEIIGGYRIIWSIKEE